MWTQADLDAMKAALAQGRRSVTFADRSETFQSADEMLRVIAEIEAELAAAANRPRQFKTYTKKGL